MVTSGFLDTYPRENFRNASLVQMVRNFVPVSVWLLFLSETPDDLRSPLIELTSDPV